MDKRRNHKENRTYLKLNYNENKAFQHLLNAAKAVFNKKGMGLQAYIRK